MGSHNGNGHTPAPITFPTKAAIPIIGQPFELKLWFVQLLVTCKCADPQPVLIVGIPGGAQGQCSACHRVFVLQSLGVDPATGNPQFNLGMGYATDAQETDR